MASTKTKGIHVNNKLLDVIAPTGIVFEKNRFWFSENLCQVLVISGYPEEGSVGWISKLCNMPGVICTIHAEHANSSVFIEKLDVSIKSLGVKINQGNEGVSAQKNLRKYKNANDMVNRVDAKNENVFFGTVVVFVFGRDAEDLATRIKKVRNAIAGSRMKARLPIELQEKALNAASPFGLLPEEIKNIGARNMPVSTLASSYPFHSSGLNDGNGFVLGHDGDDGILLLDIWKRGGDRVNSNWTILGDSGIGKSTTIKKILKCLYALGSAIIINDPQREYKEFCDNVGGQWVNCGGGKGGRINILQIRNVPLDDDDDNKSTETQLYMDEGHGLGQLALHIQTLRTFFKLYSKDIDNIDMAILEEVIEKLYGKYGITWGTDISNANNKDFPIMSELYQLTRERFYEPEAFYKKFTERKRERLEKLTEILRVAGEGADSAILNGHTTLTANSDFIVLDTLKTQQADDVIKRAQKYNINSWVWNQCTLDRNQQIFYANDEAYLDIDPDVPNTLKFMRNFAKQIRKFEGGLATISHAANDFLDNSIRMYGQALLDMACYKLLMGTDGNNLKDLVSLYSLTQKEQEILLKKERSHGVLLAGKQRIHAVVDCSDYEIEIFGKGGGR